MAFRPLSFQGQVGAGQSRFEVFFVAEDFVRAKKDNRTRFDLMRVSAGIGFGQIKRLLVEPLADIGLAAGDKLLILDGKG